MSETIQPLTKADWPELIEKMHSGEVCLIDAEVFDYFLGVLPPVFMNDYFPWPEKEHPRRYSFGFAEGYDPITVFWEMGGNYFCQQTTIMNLNV